MKNKCKKGSGLLVPKGMTEAQVLAAIDRAADLVAPKFRFGYYTLDDMKQQARIEGMKGMETYDPSRPLDNFLYVHIHNRLHNFKRDNYRRNDPPCMLCHDGRQHEHEDGLVCHKYATWEGRNSTKANLVSPFPLSPSDDESIVPPVSDDDPEYKELLERIDEKIPVDLRSTYLKMRAGARDIPKAKRLLVEQAVREVLDERDEW